MKFLCICQYGHSRSVCLARALHARNHAAVVMGYGTSGDAIQAFLGWPDVIFLMTPEFLPMIPEAYQGKVTVLDVGPDRWSNPYNQELRQILDARLDKWFEQHKKASCL